MDTDKIVRIQDSQTSKKGEAKNENFIDCATSVVDVVLGWL